MNRIKLTRVFGRSVTALFFGAVLASCGGGGGGDVAQAPAPNTMSGVAAVGYPIVGGTVSVVCAAGAAPATITSTAGAWQVSATGLTLPCAVQVSGGSINGVASTAKYHFIAISIGTVNITPLTDLMVANFAGRSDPDVWFTGLTPAVVAQITPASVNTALTNLRTALVELIPLGTTNPITTVFTPAAGNAVDDMLVALKVAMTTTTVTHTALLSNASLSGFTAPTGFGAALTTAFAGTVSGGAKPPVTGIIATVSNGQVTITWNPVAGATFYKLYMDALPSISKTTPTAMHHPNVTSPFVHTNLANGTTYYFVVTAVNVNGESIESSVVSAIPQASRLGFNFASVAGGCVQDNITGLMWEVKTADGGLRDWTKTYTNYDSISSAQKIDFATGLSSNPTQAEIDALTNSIGFKNSVNTQGLCGFSDWRLPTMDELGSLIKIKSIDAAGLVTPAYIDAAWFPNTLATTVPFWSASPAVSYSTRAQVLDFGVVKLSTHSTGARYFASSHVRLVRTGP